MYALKVFIMFLQKYILTYVVYIYGCVHAKAHTWRPEENCGSQLSLSTCGPQDQLKHPGVPCMPLLQSRLPGSSSFFTVPFTEQEALILTIHNLVISVVFFFYPDLVLEGYLDFFSTIYSFESFTFRLTRAILSSFNERPKSTSPHTENCLLSLLKSIGLYISRPVLSSTDKCVYSSPLPHCLKRWDFRVSFRNAAL